MLILRLFILCLINDETARMNIQVELDVLEKFTKNLERFQEKTV